MDGCDSVRARSGLGACCCASLMLAALTTTPTPARAQASRTDVIAAQQEEKSKSLMPRVPKRAERIVKWVEDELIDEPSGVYPVFGSVYEGGGFAAGAGYRRYYGDNTHWDVKAMHSIRNNRLIELSTDSWNHQGGTLDLHARAGWRDAPGVPFHGLGIDSARDGAAGFGLTQTYIGGDVAYRPVARTRLRAGVTFEDYSMDERGGSRPAVQARFTLAGAPALGMTPAYVHASAAAGYDWRPAAGYARRGGFYEVRYHHYTGRGADTFSRVESEVVQHVPLVRENWVLSFRGVAESVLDDDAMVPFYLMSTLGGSDTLRGYSSWRFRDRHAALGTAEFRWMPNRNLLDVALFYDAGMVAPRFDGLAIDRFASNVGIGVRFHNLTSTPVRIELAKGREGLRLIFAGSAAF
jgi:hypothetical protein